MPKSTKTDASPDSDRTPTADRSAGVSPAFAGPSPPLPGKTTSAANEGPSLASQSDRSAGVSPAVAGASPPLPRKTAPAANEGPSLASQSGRSAGVSPAVAGASRPRFGEVTIHDRGHLPHWEKDASTYFVTFRLADSLPKSVLEQIQSERESIIKTANQLGRNLSPSELKRMSQLSTKKIEQYLDSCAGACHLGYSTIANLVAASMAAFDDKRYRLLAWCVMPNHVHAILRLFPGQKLPSIVHSWKSYTAKKANKMLARTGSFWQREYYDHLIRDGAELDRAIQYVADNPVKAKLANWRWVWVWGRDAPATAGEKPALPADSSPNSD